MKVLVRQLVYLDFLRTEPGGSMANRSCLPKRIRSLLRAAKRFFFEHTAG